METPTGRLTTLTTRTARYRYLQQDRYRWDVLGNLRQRTWQAGNTWFDEVLSYDALNRLTQAETTRTVSRTRTQDVSAGVKLPTYAGLKFPSLWMAPCTAIPLSKAVMGRFKYDDLSGRNGLLSRPRWHGAAGGPAAPVGFKSMTGTKRLFITLYQ